MNRLYVCVLELNWVEEWMQNVWGKGSITILGPLYKQASDSADAFSFTLLSRSHSPLILFSLPYMHAPIQHDPLTPNLHSITNHALALLLLFSTLPLNLLNLLLTTCLFFKLMIHFSFHSLLFSPLPLLLLALFANFYNITFLPFLILLVCSSLLCLLVSIVCSFTLPPSSHLSAWLFLFPLWSSLKSPFL